ncbi:MAG: matrixin family metalloprotease [Sulfuricella sp.]|nr:matrixin family metalloprotease [Sulfuricella sp.]
MFRSRLLLALALGYTSAAAANGFDYVLWQNSPKWANSLMKWYYNPSGQPSTVSTDSMLALIQADMAKWSNACGIRFEYQGITTAAPTFNDGLNVIGWSNAQGYDGYTQYWYRGAYFSDVDVRLDPARLTATSQIDAIVTHELGHAVGLDHSNVGTAIMYANPYHSYDYQRTLRADDIAGCQALYGAATVSTSTPYAFDSTASGPVNALTLSARLVIASADRNADGAIYVAARLGDNWFFHNGSQWMQWAGGSIPTYFSGALTDRTIPLGDGIDATPLTGGQIIVGYGRNEAEMLANQRYQTIYTFSR